MTEDAKQPPDSEAASNLAAQHEGFDNGVRERFVGLFPEKGADDGAGSFAGNDIDCTLPGLIQSSGSTLPSIRKEGGIAGVDDFEHPKTLRLAGVNYMTDHNSHLEALELIAHFPLPDQDNMIAANMRDIALRAISNPFSAPPSDPREDLAMMIRVLVSSLKRHWPDAPAGALPDRAMEMLRKHGLQGSLLRQADGLDAAAGIDEPKSTGGLLPSSHQVGDAVKVMGAGFGEVDAVTFKAGKVWYEVGGVQYPSESVTKRHLLLVGQARSNAEGEQTS